MSKAGTFTIRVEHSRNQEKITVSSTGIVGTVPVNEIRSRVVYSTRTPAPDSPTYWSGVLDRAKTQLS